MTPKTDIEGGYFDCQEFHELMMDYRGASITDAHRAYEAVQQYAGRLLDQHAKAIELLAEEKRTRYLSDTSGFRCQAAIDAFLSEQTTPSDK